MSLFKLVKEHLSPVMLLFLIWIIVVLINFSADTFLSGWDNLHPEFNFGINVTRSLSAVWQEYQGVGLLGGMAHAADLSRQLVLWLFSIVLPMNLLRYGWTFTMLLLGPLGVYFFLSKITGNKLSGFVASMFYLFNLATVQYFYVPFEAFVTFYGFLPWLTYAAYLNLTKPTKKTLLAYFFISLMGTSAFYVQTLFVVYALILGMLSGFLVLTKNTKMKNIAVLALITLLTNAFWLLPVLYFSLTKAYVVDTSKINSIASPETRLMNQGFGDLLSVTRLKGFWLEYTDARGGEFGYLMPTWHKWTQTVLYNSVSLLLFIGSIVGLTFSFVFKKSRDFVLFSFFVLIFSLLFLSSGRAPLGIFYDLLSKTVPLFAEMFRSPFTKWSIPLVFTVSIGLGLLVNNFYKKAKVASFILTLILAAMCLYQVKPIFSGKLVHDELYVNLPDEYLRLFEFFENEPKESRIARFPVQSFWGWDFNDWGYRGSGFLWYGIEQPILDRAFDVWSRENEAYYFEINHAVYQKDLDLFKQVIDKYQLGYALVDESVIITGEDQSSLNYQGIYELLDEIGAEKMFDEGKLKVYKFDTQNGFVQAPKNYALAQIVGEVTRIDPAYSGNNASYVSSDSQIYPFWDLTGERLSYVSYASGFEREKVVLSRDIKNLAEYDLIVPPLNASDTIYMSGEIFLQDQELLITFDRLVEFEGAPNLEPISISVVGAYSKLIMNIGGEPVEVSQGQKQNFKGAQFSLSTGLKVQAFDAISSQEIDLSSGFSADSFQVCWEREGGDPEINVTNTDGEILAQTKDAVACSSTKVGQLGSGSHFVEIKLPYRSQEAARPHFCLVKEGESECLHKDVFYHTNPSTNWAVVERKMALPGEDAYWLVLSARPPEEKGQSWEIKYQEPTILVYPLVSEVVVNPSLLTEYFKPLRLNITSGSNLKLVFPANKVELDFANTGNARNCDLFDRGSIEKTTDENKVIYKAKDRAAVCDYLLADLGTQNDFLLRIKGEQKSGRSLKAYLYNTGSEKNDLEIIMDNGSFDNTFSMLSWPWEKEYVLNLEARSFGKETSEIALNKVGLYNFPVSWVTGFRLVKDDFGVTTNHVEVGNYDKLGTFLYSVDVLAEEDGIFTLSQAYDGGWIAFDKKLTAFKHLKFNGWANAWEVPQGEYTVYIFYWPQLLQFAGFLSLIFVFSYLILKKK